MFPLIFKVCATVYQNSSVFITMHIKYVQKHFSKEHLCALKVSLCAFVSRPLCARTCAQLRGNIGHKAQLTRPRLCMQAVPFQFWLALYIFFPRLLIIVSRQLIYGHFVYDTSSTDIWSTDISSTMT